MASEDLVAHPTPDMLPAGDGSTDAAAPPCRVVTCFSPKGGVGCSMIAVNLAVSLQGRGYRTVLVDGSLSAGTVDAFLGLGASNAILHLIRREAPLDALAVQRALVRHSSGVQVLLAPREPEQGETITSEHMRAILTIVRACCDVIVVDTSVGYDERVLMFLDSADRIIVPVAPDHAALKSAAAFLRVSRLLGHAPERLLLVLVRADSVPPQEIGQIERFLGRPFDHRVPSDGRAATAALNEGSPVVLRYPTIPLSASIVALVDLLDRD